MGDASEIDPTEASGTAVRRARAAACQMLAVLGNCGETLAVAESLTGGLLAATIVDVPGASTVFRGGIVAYATDLKAALLGVDATLLAECGAVDPEVAGAMAVGVRDALGATFGLSTTGVAGPDPQDGKAPGTVYVGLAGAGREPLVREFSLVGTRSDIRWQTVAAALEFLVGALELDAR